MDPQGAAIQHRHVPEKECLTARRRKMWGQVKHQKTGTSISVDFPTWDLAMGEKSWQTDMEAVRSADESNCNSSDCRTSTEINLQHVFQAAASKSHRFDCGCILCAALLSRVVYMWTQEVLTISPLVTRLLSSSQAPQWSGSAWIASTNTSTASLSRSSFRSTTPYLRPRRHTQRHF